MRKIFMKGLLLLVPVFFMTFAAMSQSIVKGKIIDSETKEELVGACAVVVHLNEVRGIARLFAGAFRVSLADYFNFHCFLLLVFVDFCGWPPLQ